MTPLESADPSCRYNKMYTWDGNAALACGCRLIALRSMLETLKQILCFRIVRPQPEGLAHLFDGIFPLSLQG
jgi:hypothetical protein